MAVWSEPFQQYEITVLMYLLFKVEKVLEGEEELPGLNAWPVFNRLTFLLINGPSSFYNHADVTKILL